MCTYSYVAPKVSQSAVDYVVEGATNLIQQSLAEYETKIHHLLLPHPSIAEQVKQSMSQQQTAPFAKLRSAYLQTKFVEENLPYVVSMYSYRYAKWLRLFYGCILFNNRNLLKLYWEKDGSQRQVVDWSRKKINMFTFQFWKH